MSRGQVQIIEMQGSPDYCRADVDIDLDTHKHAITGVNQGAKTFTVAGNITAQFVDVPVIQITESTGNDGYYTVVSATFDTDHTDVVVVEVIPDGTVDGYLLTNFRNWDSQADKLPIVEDTEKYLWEDNDSFLYLGWDDIAYGFGIVLCDLGSYEGMTYEYYNGSTWVEFTPLYDGTAAYSKPGLVLWGGLEDWDLFTVNDQEAYWIRIRATTVTAQASFYNLLKSLTLDRPLVLGVECNREKYYFDTEGKVQKTEVSSTKPTSASANCTQPTITMFGLNLCIQWRDDRRKLWIIDLAYTEPIDWEQDAYYKVHIGYLDKITKETYSPHKMKCQEYTLDFIIEDSLGGSDRMASTIFELVGESEWDWVRHEGTTALEGDAGEGFPSGLQTG